MCTQNHVLYGVLGSVVSRLFSRVAYSRQSLLNGVLEGLCGVGGDKLCELQDGVVQQEALADEVSSRGRDQDASVSACGDVLRTKLHATVAL